MPKVQKKRNLHKENERKPDQDEENPDGFAVAVSCPRSSSTESPILRRSARLAGPPWATVPMSHVLRHIFQHLNGESLHRARQVCREWDRVIRVEVWGSTEGRRAVEARLHNNWLTAQPKMTTTVHTWQSLHHTDHEYHSCLAAEDKIVILKDRWNYCKAHVFIIDEEGEMMASFSTSTQVFENESNLELFLLWSRWGALQRRW